MDAVKKISKLICSLLNSTPINVEKFHTSFIQEIIGMLYGMRICNATLAKNENSVLLILDAHS